MFVSNVKLVQASPTSGLKFKFSLLWAVIRFFFSNETQLTLQSNVKLNIGEHAITAEYWVNSLASNKYEHRAVSFDGKTAIGYVDGVRV